MQKLTEEGFLAIARQAGIDFDPKYPKARSLTYLLPESESRFWERPKKPSEWRPLVSSVLTAAGAKGPVLVFPRHGHWPRWPMRVIEPDHTVAFLMRAMGIPSGWNGAIEYDPSERNRLIAVLVCCWLEVTKDFYAMPRNGKCLIQFSHHDVVHISCRSWVETNAVVAAMSSAKYELPTNLPDATFKRPEWMK